MKIRGLSKNSIENIKISIINNVNTKSLLMDIVSIEGSGGIVQI